MSTSLDDTIHVVVLSLMRLYYSMESVFEIIVPLENLKRLLPESSVGNASSTRFDVDQLHPSLADIINAMSHSFCPSKEDDAASRPGIFAHDSTGNTYMRPKKKGVLEGEANEKEMLGAFGDLYPEWWQNTHEQ